MQKLLLRHDLEDGGLPEAVTERFVRLEHDQEARQYLAYVAERRRGRARTLLQRTLSCYMSDFDANGLLDMYPMYLLGTQQWRRLLGPIRGGRLLDVGAGSGDITVKLAPLFAEVVTTELSAAMAWRLRRRGLSCHSLDVAIEGVPDGPYDLISCLNVLDRTRRPRSLLMHLKQGLSPSGKLVLALPLPYQPMYYDGATTRDPEEHLEIVGSSWSEAARALIVDVLLPLGFELVALARAPYLSGGDSGEPVYELDDAIVVCRRAQD